MDCASCPSEGLAHLLTTVARSVKLLATGHFGVGTTTLVDNVLEIAPLRTREKSTQTSIGIDDLAIGFIPATRTPGSAV